MSASSKMKNLVCRNGWWTFRVTINGKPTWRGLGTQDEKTAIAAAAAMRRTLQAERLRTRLEAAGVKSDIAGDEAIAKRLGLMRQREDLATIPDIESAYRADSTGRVIKDRSIDNAVSSLLLIIRTARDDAAAAGSSSVLTEQLLMDYEAVKIRDAKAEGPLAVKSALVTAASTIRQAKSVFCDEARRGAQMRLLRLPDLAQFRTFEPKENSRRVRVPVDDATLLRLKGAVDDLWFSAPVRWLALALCGNLGLRRGSAKNAKWTWARRVGGQWRMYLVADADSQPKGNEYFVTITDGLWQDMCAVRAEGSDYIIPGATLEERDRPFEENVQWLRDLGLDVDKPNHELRAIFAQTMKREHGGAMASEGLGHGNQKLLPVYAGRGAEKGVRPL